MNNKQSFDYAYSLVKTGFIKHELTAREIAEQFPNVEIDAFVQGILDGLSGEDWRYSLNGLAQYHRCT